MERRGDVWVESALVMSVEDGGPRGARLEVETEGGATKTVYLTAHAYAELVRERTDGCADALLGRPVHVDALHRR